MTMIVMPLPAEEHPARYAVVSVFCLSSLELSMQDKADVMWMQRPKFNLRRGAQRSIS